MTRTYKATGINLKGVPFGEGDRLLTILTPEVGLLRVVAPGARKHSSKLRGRVDLFVVNELLIYRGRSLDRITQAETLRSYPGLSRDLGKLAASQYLAEIVLYQAPSDQPQVELYELLLEHLHRIEQLPPNGSPVTLLSHLSQAVYHLLVVAGIAPQVYRCAITHEAIAPNLNDPHWRVGFSIAHGGAIAPAELARWETEATSSRAAEASSNYQTPSRRTKSQQRDLTTRLSALETILLQQLPQPDLLGVPLVAIDLTPSWVRIERLLRFYAQHHLEHQIRSADLLDSYVQGMHGTIATHS